MLVAFVVPATIVLILRVHGQNVESSEPNVVGVLEESVEFQWKVHRGFKNVTITGLNVYNGTGIVNFPNLFLFNGQLIKSPGVPERLNATIEGIVNDDIEVIYKIIMENVKYTDAGTTLYLNAVFEPLAQSGATVTLFTVKGRPEVCQGGFPSNFTFDDKSSPRINITLCGVPQPEVQAEFNGEKINVRSTTVNNYTHTFTLQLPLLTQQVCGEELTINASGYNGTLTNKTKIFLRDFVPAKVNIDNFFENRDKHGCNGTRRVQWHPLPTGNCPVEYTIEFRNSTGGIIGTVNNIMNNSYCTSKYDDAKSVFVWASFNGRKGNKSEEQFLTATPKPTTSTTITSPSTNRKENSTKPRGAEPKSDSTTTIIIVVVVLVVIIAAVIVVIIMIKKKHKEGSIRSKKSQDDVVELKPPNYTDEGDYASVEAMQEKTAPENNPDQMLYAELGAGGGRKGPKPEPMESNYAQVKVDEMGYPARGPASDMSQPAPYPTSINRDRSRRHSPPPNYGEIDDDDDDGVIV